MDSKEKHISTYKSILEEIKRLENRISEIDKTISDYRDSIELVGRSSKLGQALRSEISILSGEKNQIPSHITELKEKASMFSQIIDNIDELVNEQEETMDSEENNTEELNNELILEEKIENIEINETNEIKDDIEEAKENIDSNKNDTNTSSEVINFLNMINNGISKEVPNDVIKEEIEENIEDFIEQDLKINQEELFEDKKENINFKIPDFILKNEESKLEVEKKLEEDKYIEEDNFNYIDVPTSLIISDLVTGENIKMINIEGAQYIPSMAFQMYKKYGKNISIDISYDCYKNGELIYHNSNIKNINEVEIYKDTLDGLIAMEEFENEQNNVEIEEKVSKEIPFKLPDFILKREENNNLEKEEIKENNSTVIDTDEKIQNIKVTYSKNSRYYYVTEYDVLENGRLVHKSKQTKDSISRLFLTNKNARKLVAEKYNIDVLNPIYNNIDLSVVDRLERIDKEYNTDYAKEYVNGELDIQINYDINSIITDCELSFKEKFKQLKIAYSQKLLANVSYNYPKKLNYLKKAIPAAMLMLLAPLGIKGYNQVKSVVDEERKATYYSQAEKTEEVEKNKTITTEEITTEKQTTEEKTKEQGNENEGKYYSIIDGKKYATLDAIVSPENKEENKTTEADTTEKNEESNNNETETFEENNEEVNNQIETVSDGEYRKLGLNGKITLTLKDGKGDVVSTQKLSSDSWGNGKTFSASKLDCDYFKISYISMYTDDFYIDPIRVKQGDNVDEIVNSLYKKYGADINISFNFDGYVNDKDEPIYKVVGWLNSDNIVPLSYDDKEAIAGFKNNDSKKLSLTK